MVNRKQVNTLPLSFLTDGRLVCYQLGDIVVFENGRESQRFPLFNSFKEQFLGRNKLINRLLRLGIRSVEAIDDNTIILSIGNMIYELTISKRELSKGYFCGDGIRPFQFTNVKNINCIEDGVYYGEYLLNMGKKPVNLYRRTGIDKWESIFTFPQGSINHIHKIVADPYRQCLWIFTGDFDESSAIWKVTDNFQNVERVVCNDQKYRGCVVNVLPEGILYATDAPFTNNYICLMNPSTFEVQEIFPIDGSCIYGCKWKDKYVFSTTVEGDGRNMSRLEWLFTHKRGAGIKDDYVHMYMGNLQEGFKEIFKEKKDCMPFFPFQFGVFKFPSGANNSNRLYFQPVATKKHDLSLMAIEESTKELHI